MAKSNASFRTQLLHSNLCSKNYFNSENSNCYVVKDDFVCLVYFEKTILFVKYCLY